ncbi:MAG TPA: ABC-type transport auxiliary lipoprotein family protein [Oleiagrimonas sp.]|nr:ABC-type transport auxiliary lipoprotein family protein [Oleiagrimonas sp.]
MKMLYAMLCASALLLSGCMSTGQTRTVQHYALGAPVATPAGAHPAASGERDVLKVARVTVPPWLAGTDMYYRLDYRDGGQLSAYGQSDWAAPPATLLEPWVQAALSASGQWRAVVGPRNPATADVSLHLRLEDFSQIFASPEQSTGVIDATATLLDNADASVVAQKHFHVTVPSPSADARGGATALREASHALARQISRWLGTR